MNNIYEALQQQLAAPHESSEGAVVQRFELAADFPAFQGHFPENPILPAFVQVMLARMALTHWLESQGLTPPAITGVERAKFMLPIGPGALQVQITTGKKGYVVDIETSQGRAASIILRCHETQDHS